MQLFIFREVEILEASVHKELVHKKKTNKPSWNRRWTSYKLFLMALPFLALVFIFCYYPLYGWIYALYDYNPAFGLKGSPYVGFEWFTILFSSSVRLAQIRQVMVNTLAMAFLGIFTSWIPMAFAVFLAEIRSRKFSRIVQTVTTLPNFVSMVTVFSIAYIFLSSEGTVNSILMNLHIISKPILFLVNDNNTWIKMWAWQTWKGLGWSAILYLAAISGIDQTLYEAARVDGAGRFRLMWHITLPGLLPTFFVLLLLSIASLLTTGMDVYYLFANAFNMKHIQVLDLYLYYTGIQNGSYSLATAVGIMRSVISVILLFAANWGSKAVRGESII